MTGCYMEHYSLLDLNKLIGKALTKNLEASYWVIAEIGEMRLTQKGHCYLEMVEKEGDFIKAKNRATIWSYTYRNLITWFEKMTGQTLQPGLKILFNATIQYHEVYGLSLNIRDIDANFTLGERARRKAEIIEKLIADGVFEMNKEQSLPLVPQRIAVVSSPTAAGYGDFMDQLSNNAYQYQFEVCLFKATMQGAEAEQSIIAAMHEVFQRVNEFDLLVIIRGGGASVDLDCFDSYELASHIAQFPLPVVTGIGHERDETICDLVANTKLKTPTAVSEFLITGILRFDEQLQMQKDRLTELFNQKIDEETLWLERKANMLLNGAMKHNHRQQMKLSSLVQRMQYSIRRNAENKENHLNELKTKLFNSPERAIKNESKRIEVLEKIISSNSPENLLKRGYAIAKVNGKVINGKSKLSPGDRLETILSNKILQSTIDKVNNRNKDA